MATEPIVIDQYYLNKGIFNQSLQISNCNEAGFPFNPKWLKIVDQAGSRNTSTQNKIANKHS